METLIQQFINGLVIGSVYALIALGYTMVYGILGLINFAHGDVLMVGALVALQTMLFMMGIAPGMSPLVMLAIALAVAMAICMLLGFTMERLAYRRLRNAPRLAPLITAIGVSFLLQTLAMIIWGRNYHTFPQLISTTPLQPIPGVFVTPVQVTIVVVSALSAKEIAAEGGLPDDVTVYRKPIPFHELHGYMQALITQRRRACNGA